MVEPVMANVNFLRDIITDPNTTRADSDKMIWPGWPREDLGKTSFPRISVIQIDEDGLPVAIGNTTGEETTYIFQIDVWIWAKEKDEQILTIDSVKYSGTKLRDYVARLVSNAYMENFYSDSNLGGGGTGYYSYEKRRFRDIPFDNEKGIMRKLIEVTMKKVN